MGEGGGAGREGDRANWGQAVKGVKLNLLTQATLGRAQRNANATG